MSGAIYLIQNKTNGKVYVGQTETGSCFRRYNCANPAASESDRPIDRAFKKYGGNGFHFQDLMTGVPIDQLDFWERFFIKSFSSTERENGYNVESGGMVKSRAISDETRLRLRESHVGIGRKIIHLRHRVHGDFVGTAHELMVRFPNQGLTKQNLHAVASGRHIGHKGWRSINPKKSKRYLVRTWVHSVHGRFVGTAAELIGDHKELKSSGLSLVERGKAGQHHGWSIEGLEFASRRKPVPIVTWEHPEHGVFRGSIPELCSAFKDQRLNRGNLRLAVLGVLGVKQSKGWRVLSY